MELILAQLSESAPWLVKVIFYVGLARLIMKPIMSAAAEIVKLTPSQKDDAFLAKMLDNKIYKAISFGLDYIASIKLPKKDK